MTDQPADINALVDAATQKMIEEGAATEGADVSPLEALGYHAMGLSYALERVEAERDALREQLDAAIRRYDSHDAMEYALGPLIDRPFRSLRPRPEPTNQSQEQ